MSGGTQERAGRYIGVRTKILTIHTDGSLRVRPQVGKLVGRVNSEPDP